MKYCNSLFITITLVLLTSLISCKPKRQGLDSKVRCLIESNFTSKYNPFIIDRITYDTIGTGEWSYHLAELMIDHPEWFSDKGLLDELSNVINDIDTTDHRLRLIANVYGHDQWRGGAVYYIGIIGDSLSNIEEKTIFSEAPIEALLDICSPAEKRILDMATVIELSDRNNFSSVNKTIMTILSNWCSVHKFSTTQPIFNAKGHTKDITLQLQFVGIELNDNVDSIILKHPEYSITKDFSFENYGCYHLKNSIETISGIHELETVLYTIDNRIVLLKAICNDRIDGELYEMYETKYGKDVNFYSFDETFIKRDNGSTTYIWSFSNNGIILINNTYKFDTYSPDFTYQKPKILRSDYVFNNVIIVYCDKQMYRRLVQKEEDRKLSIKREQNVLDSLNQVEKQRNDSIRKAKKEEKLKINALQI